MTRLEPHGVFIAVPRLSSHINSELNRVELRPAEPDLDHLSVCVQYERNGECQVRGHKVQLDRWLGIQSQTNQCFFTTEMERDEHPAVFRHPLHVFPGTGWSVFFPPRQSLSLIGG